MRELFLQLSHAVWLHWRRVVLNDNDPLRWNPRQLALTLHKSWRWCLLRVLIIEWLRACISPTWRPIELHDLGVSRPARVVLQQVDVIALVVLRP